jgi:ZIP family zinc transporter
MLAALQDWFGSLSPPVQALLATGFTWALTALGAAAVFVCRRIHQPSFALILGAAAGIMLAASFWSLLAPAISYADGDWVPALVGFLAGGACMLGLDRALPHLHPGLAEDQAEGPRSGLRSGMLLLLAMTLHNFPEGLAIGVTFGAAAQGIEGASIGAAVALAIGIGLQNLPEGTAVAMPLRATGMSRLKCFGYGQASALVEPLGGYLGAAAVTSVRPLLPYALAFAAGAMGFVGIQGVIPRSQQTGHSDLATAGALGGFALMMTLDVALG